jgi:5-(carboxyamino)imidazole ribonucleotide synthase
MQVLVLGAGQLARMMSLVATPLNIQVCAYDVGSDTIVEPVSQRPLELTLAQALLQVDAVTSEFEHIPHPVLDICQASGKFLPSAAAIKTGGDRRIEKQLLEKAGVANARHRVITCKTEFFEAIEALGTPLILKSALAGYDGKGQWRYRDPAQAEAIWQEIEAFFEGADHSVTQAIIAEEMIPFKREVSLVGVRSVNGETSAYPLAENHHTNGVLSVSLVLSDSESLQVQAQQMFDAIADALNYIGVLAIEFFEIDGRLLVNEIAPRVHNSGHWSQQGADICQFENHIRAVCGLPLGSTSLVRPTAMVNILGEDSVDAQVLAIPGLKLHWYGKEKRAGRKMGHINVSAQDQAQLAERLGKLASLLPQAAFPDLAAIAHSIQPID